MSKYQETQSMNRSAISTQFHRLAKTLCKIDIFIKTIPIVSGVAIDISVYFHVVSSVEVLIVKAHDRLKFSCFAY